ncbi:battenin-like [Schistocerca gregaria]|uniref:battenin-like n=1 Tax=Schistocerca gregaria TaxID=7010 RepID=UPI00211DDAE5|nr:battenin-like [Schistocerca gregaria]
MPQEGTRLLSPQRHPNHSKEADHEEATTQRPPNEKKNLQLKLDAMSFFVFGLFNNFGYVIMLSAAQAISNGEYSESAVLMADILPSLIIKLTAPFFAHRLSFPLRIWISTISNLAAFQLVAYPKSAKIRLLGVSLSSVGSGLGEITFLALSSHFHKSTVSAWSSGTGAAGIFGSGWYFFFISVGPYFIHKMSIPFVTVISASPLPILSLILYHFLLSSPSPPPFTSSRTFPFFSRFHLLPSLLLPYILPLLSVYFLEYLINQAIAPSIVYPTSPIHCKEYELYQLLYQLSVFFSRSSSSFLSISQLWWPVLLQLLNALLLLLHSIFHFLPYIVVTIVILLEGFLGGVTYLNAYLNISSQLHSHVKEFVMSITGVSDSIGISLASLVGLYLGPKLKLINHQYLSQNACYTRKAPL